MTLFKKTYVWSVCLEPLLFFNFLGYIYSSGFALSRVLQLIIFISLLAKFIINSFKAKSFNVFDPMYKYYSYFMLFSVVVGIFGFMYGAYFIPSIPMADTMFISLYRPIIEYIIAIYYFFYFVVLFRIIINDSMAIDYFFKVFSWLFYFSLFIGLFDLVLMFITNYEYGGLPRHIQDFTQVGFRFHGLGGEPRESFVYLVLGIGVLFLKDIWRGEKKLTKKILLLIIIAMILTDSFSGLIGLLFSCGLILLFCIPKITISKQLLVLGVIIFIIAIVALSISNSDRLMNYYGGFQTLYVDLTYGYSIGGHLNQGAMVNIYPIWHRWLEVLNLNILPLLFGTGLGTASVINNVYYMESNVSMNPNSNLIRMLYDVGIIGVLLLIKSFVYPVSRLYINKDMRLKLLLCMLFIVGAFFAHRSVAPFLFLGIMIVAIENKFQRIR